MELGTKTGPLRGLRVVEIAGIGPAPHACTLLADLGADVIRIDRLGGPELAYASPETDLLTRGRPSVALDLKRPEAVAAVLDLVASADVLVEGMRPGAMERLGLGPDVCLARNPRLVYGRMTGWGQDGPWARRAGHDLTYIAVTGALHASGQDPVTPQFPMNLLGDFGGGSLYLVVGVLSALLEARTSGQGQVVDAAIVDGTAHLALIWSAVLASGTAREQRGVNVLDGGLSTYRLYATSDGRHLAVGALEPRFVAELVRVLGLSGDPTADEIAAVVATRTQAEWMSLFEGTDACVAPVLPHSEALRHPHLVARETFTERDGVVQPSPAPRFDRTSPSLTTPPARPGQHTREALRAWGVDPEPLLASGAATQA